MDNTTLAELRRDYSLKELSESSVASDPIDQFSIWMDEALHSELIDANAMTLSTVGQDGKPSVRVVLLKGFGSDGFVFFTNYTSKKGRDLEANPYASLSFFWPQLERQVMIYGPAEKTSREESEAYFKTRPADSRIGAWASRQSSELSSRQELEQRIAELRLQYPGDEIPCPPHWGGFRVKPEKIEFWQGRESRLHDRICYERENGSWRIYRLSP